MLLVGVSWSAKTTTTWWESKHRGRVRSLQLQPKRATEQAGLLWAKARSHARSQHSSNEAEAEAVVGVVDPAREEDKSRTELN